MVTRLWGLGPRATPAGTNEPRAFPAWGPGVAEPVLDAAAPSRLHCRIVSRPAGLYLPRLGLAVTGGPPDSGSELLTQGASDVSDIASNLLHLRDDIAEHAVRCGRRPEEIQLLAVSKTFPPEAVSCAADAGQLLFGENRIQEAEEKIPRCRGGLEWHLIGHLQSNKAKLSVELFDVVQTVDSLKLAKRLGRLAVGRAQPLRVMIQVNVGDEPQKSGTDPQHLEPLIEAVDSQASLRLLGLMAIPPYDPDPEKVRPYFARLRELLEQVNRSRPRPLDQLSMGMSGDYPDAIQEGATLLRIGTAIFGPRAS